MDEKTNVMRILDQKKIKYNKYCYADTDAISGVEVQGGGGGVSGTEGCLYGGLRWLFVCGVVWGVVGCV